MSLTSDSSAPTRKALPSGAGFKVAQKIGKSFMLPIAILPAAGLLLGIGGALSNPTTVEAYPVLDNAVLQTIFTVILGYISVVNYTNFLTISMP